MSKIQKEILRKEYISRINKAIDYILKHYDQELSLEKIAEAANFSRFHFHRIFSAMTGETIYAFVKRKRLEYAASYLMENENQSIAEIAIKCGFQNQASFSRAFKEYYEMSPTAFMEGGYMTQSKIRIIDSNNGKTKSNNGKTEVEASTYLSADVKLKNKLRMKVEIKDLPKMTLAYCRHKGAYNKVKPAFEKLMRWAGPRGLLNDPELKILSIYHDDPKVTEEENLLTDACISVPPDTKVEGEIGKHEMEGGKYAIAHFVIDENGFSDAWNQVMGKWLPESGYVCDDRFHFELCHNDPKDHPEKKHEIDICIPIRPL